MTESLGQCCISGVTWEGTPEGQVRRTPYPRTEHT